MTDIWKNKRVLVTGAAGLLGPWVVRELLDKQATVFALVRDHIPDALFFEKDITDNASIIYGDLLDLPLLTRVLNECEIDAVFHLGAQAIVGIANRSPLSTFRSNIEGTWNLLEACRLSPWVKKIVVASSDKAYGAQPILPYTEEMPLQGRYPYDVSKTCTDLLAQSYFHTYKLPVCITRCGNFFGPGDLHFNRIVPGTIWSVLDHERPVIRTDGTLIRDYIYVKDVAHAYVMLAEKMDDTKIHGESFNFSTDKPYNVKEVVAQILSVMNAPAIKPKINNEATCEIPAQHLSSEKARKRLKWTPKYGVRKGLEETVAWYRIYHAQKRGLSVTPAQRSSSKQVAV
jgi:CDP-glucose 4,6-dehydratase